MARSAFAFGDARVNKRMFSLSGRKALVTGSSRGIGNAVAVALGRAGASVVFHGASYSDALASAVRDAASEGIECSYVCGDLSDSAQVRRISAESGEPDILVLNASVQKYVSDRNFNSGDFESMIDTNLRSCFEFIKALVPAMAAKGWGRVISIGSVNQMRPASRLAVYACIKAAQHNLMLSCAKEYAAAGITFNTVSPGVIVTDRNKEALSNEDFSAGLIECIPAKRFGKPEDCAGVAVFLASDCASYVTGANIPVAGGFQL